MKVLMVSTSYPENAQDWRGRFVANSAAALARREEVALSLWAPPGELPANLTAAATPGDACWLKWLSQQGGIAHLVRERKVLAAGAVFQLLARLGRSYRRRPPPDVAHVNWLQNALPLWGTRTPALIAVLGSDFGLLRLPGMKAALRAVMRQRRAILAPNAEWMRPELERIFGDLAEVRPIAFGVDDPWFAVIRNPPEGVRHWLVVSRLTRNKIGDLFDWGAGLFGRERQLHLFGPMQEKIDVPRWVHYHGPTHPAELLDTWFPTACGLITLSRHDEGRPQVMLEAMASGLPVIASDLSAHRDIIRHGQTGYLVASDAELREAMTTLEIPGCNREAGEAARAWIKENIGTWDDCAARYVSAYRRLLERKS